MKTDAKEHNKWSFVGEHKRASFKQYLKTNYKTKKNHCIFYEDTYKTNSIHAKHKNKTYFTFEAFLYFTWIGACHLLGECGKSRMYIVISKESENVNICSCISNKEIKMERLCILQWSQRIQKWEEKSQEKTRKPIARH